MQKKLKDYDEVEDYLYGMKTVRAERVVDDSRRWSNSYDKVVFDEGTNTYWLIEWEAGSTEYQDMTFDEQDWTATEVEPVEKVITDYVPM